MTSTIEGNIPSKKVSHALPILVAALSVLILSGCSSTVIFESDLEGAEVTTIAGQKYGVTPVSVSFSKDDLDASRGPDGCARILGVTYTCLRAPKSPLPTRSFFAETVTNSDTL